jgi:hypothetical protein
MAPRKASHFARIGGLNELLLIYSRGMRIFGYVARITDLVQWMFDRKSTSCVRMKWGE